MRSAGCLAEMKITEITQIDPSVLINIEEIEISEKLNDDDRLLDFINKVKNPYCFLCGQTPVRVRFVDSEKTLSQSLSSFFIGLK